MKFIETSKDEIDKLEDDVPGKLVQDFLESGKETVKVDLRDLNSNALNFINGVRMFIRYHELEVEMKKKGDWLFLTRSGDNG